MVGLGFLGIALPVLPTTPFLLLALWFFSRSSDRLRRWLLTNRLFGRYISDYSSGRGIPLRVKIYALILMWAAIGYSALWIVNSLWLKIILLAIAIGTTVHILRIRTKKCLKKIVIMVPTREEAEGFGSVFDMEFVSVGKWFKVRKGVVPVVVSGVGMAETAAAVAAVITAQKPDAVILAGIAGAYPWSGFVPGDCVLVTSEHIADLGAMRDENFTPLFRKKNECVLNFRTLPCAVGSTVNCAGRTGRDGKNMDGGYSTNCAAQVENMEGAAFFAVCGAMGIPFAEVRAISNITTDKRSDWQIGLAVQSLAVGVKKIADEIKN